MSGFRKCYGSYGRLGTAESSEVGGDDLSMAGKYTSTTSATQPDKSYIPRLCRSRDPYTAYKSKKEEFDKKNKTENYTDKKQSKTDSYLDKKKSPADSYLDKKKSPADSYLDKKKSTADSYLDKKKSTADSYLDKKKSPADSYLDKKASVLNYPDNKPTSSSYGDKKSSNLYSYADKKPITGTYLDKKSSSLSYGDKKPTIDNYVDKSRITSSYIDKKPNMESYMEKKAALDFNRLKVPVTKTPKSRESSPISSLKFNMNSIGKNKYNAHSPSFSERRSTIGLSPTNLRSRSKSPQELDIPKKTEATGYSSSYTPYKTYTRTNSFSRPVTVNEPVTEKAQSRFGYKNRIANTYYNPRLTENISPVSSLEHVTYTSDKGERQFKEKNEHSASSETSLFSQDKDASKEIFKDLPEIKGPDKDEDEEFSSDEDENATRTYVVVTRHTSPTPPGSSHYVRTRRADMAKTEEETITRLRKKPLMANKTIQTDDSRSCRFSIVRTAPARTYIDSNPSSSYLGYAGRFSTQYSSGREKSLTSPASEKSSSTTSKNSKTNDSESSEQDAQKNAEHVDTVSYCFRRPIDKGVNNSPKSIEKENSSVKSSESENNSDNRSMVNRNNTSQHSIDDDKSVESKSVKPDRECSSDIVINVNLTLNKTVSPVVSPSEKPPSHGSKKADSNKTKAKKKSGETKKSLRKANRQNSNESTESSSFTSLAASSSDDEYGSKSKKSSQSSSSSDDTSSRTSADEVSISLDKPPVTPSIPEPDEPRTKEAKTFLIKALTPITNLFKSRSQDSGDKSISSESTSKDVANITLETENTSDGKSFSNVTTNRSSSNLNRENLLNRQSNSEISDSINRLSKSSSKTSERLKKSGKKITRIESGERAWWLDASNKDSDNGKDKLTSKSSLEKSTSSSSSIGIKFRIPNKDCDEKPWWLDSCANIPEGIERLSPVRKDSISLSSEKSDNLEFNKLRHIDSGEKEWWQDSSENISKDRDSYSHKERQCSKNESKTNTETKSSLRLKPLKICHVQSGEKAWWLASNQNVPEGIEKLPPPPPGDSDSSSSESEEFEVYRPTVSPFPTQMDENHLPLGDRIGPEGLETPHEPTHGSEKIIKPISDKFMIPYNEPSHLYRKDMFEGVLISRYTDIDDLLGNSHVYNPFMDTILTRRTSQRLSFDSDCEEIDATEVKIHDSTPQRPVIKKLINRSEILDYSNEDQTKKSMSTSTETITCRVQYLNDLDPFAEYTPREPARPLYYTFNITIPLSYQLAGVHRLLRAPQQLDDVTLQLVKDGDYGPYLDLDSSLTEQQEEFEGMQDSRKNAIVLRTQLSVRVHSIIERLLQAQGRELRRALFSLKQILQADKDLVHEFVANNGLNCLIQVGTAAEHDFLNYILRALGQILLYVDGMHGVMEHKTCVQWLYSLIGNKFRHVVKTALKLLLVFVEYTEKNSLLLIQAVHAADTTAGQQPWYNIMKILKDFNAADTELLIYAMTLINKCLNGIPDQDTYYDQTDALEEQGIDEIIQRYMSKQGTDLDLLRQFQIYEAILSHEDGDSTGIALKQLDETSIKAIRHRNNVMSKKSERRKSKRQKNSTDDNKDDNHLHEYNKCVNDSSPIIDCTQSPKSVILTSLNKEKNDEERLRKRRERVARQGHQVIQEQELFSSVKNGLSPVEDDNHLHEYNKCVNDRSPIINCTQSPKSVILTSLNKEKNDEEKMRKRRERFARQGHHIIQQQELFSSVKNGLSPVEGNFLKNKLSTIMKINNNKSPENASKVNLNGNNQIYTAGLQQRIQNGTLGHTVSTKDIASLAMRNQKQTENGISPTENKEADDRNVLLNRENTVKDLTQRLSNQNNVQNSPEEKISRVSDMTGLILKAKEGLAKSQSKDIVKSPTVEIVPKVVEVKASENELHWEELRKSLNRNLQLCDLDFTDLRVDDDDDLTASSIFENGIPPPPPPIGLFNHTGVVPPPPPRSIVPLPPPSLYIPPNSMNSLPSYDSNESDTTTIKKNKKTVKLFWKEVKDRPAPETLLNKVGGLIWEDLPEVSIDTKMLEHLFESRTNDLLIKKLTEPKNNVILDAKRSNAINIGMKKLPTPRTIKTAILKMDTTVITREGIEKLLNMQPTEEERIKIQEAQYANPDLPLGSAEQFLLALASITELASRLKLWAFKLDFEYCEKEIAEPLMDLKQGIELLKANKTFKIILSTLRSVGSFLNGTNVKGFRLEYLSKVMEVKDTVHKHPLLHHICQIIMDKFPDTSDFFSEVGPVIRASKVDFDEIGHNLVKLEAECKASWDHLKRVAKHDGQIIMKTKINEFLTDAAERIILLGIIRKRVMNRTNKFLLHIGVPLTDIPKTKPSEFLKIVAEFALEYRTSRERVLQQLEKKANHRERNKTRGKMIIDIEKYGGVAEVTADATLKQLIMTNGDDSYSLSRKKPTTDKTLNGDLNAEDEIFESFVKSTMAKRKPMIPRDRKRARIADRKSLRRSFCGLNPRLD